MPVEQITAFKTPDGKVFQDKVDAERHYETVLLKREFDGIFNNIDEIRFFDFEDLTRWIKVKKNREFINRVLKATR